MNAKAKFSRTKANPKASAAYTKAKPRKKRGITLDHDRDLDSIVAACAKDLRQRMKMLGAPVNSVVIVLDSDRVCAMRFFPSNGMELDQVTRSLVRSNNILNDSVSRFMAEHHKKYDA